MKTTEITGEKMSRSDWRKLHTRPTKFRPDWDYYWDAEKMEWVQVKDDDDMTSWWDGLFCFKKGTGKYPPEMHMTGKQWKAEFCDPHKGESIDKYNAFLFY